MNSTSAITKLRARVVVVFLIAFCAPAYARRAQFEFGVRAGVPVTPFVESNTPQVSRQETFNRAWVVVGPTAGIVIRERFRVELDATYKRIRGRSKSILPPTGVTFEYRAASFEFPLLLVYNFSKGSVRPFAGGGVVAGHIVTGTTKADAPLGGTPFVGNFSMGNQLPAYVVNGGVEWKTSKRDLRSEVRYTKWDRNPGAQIRRNQLEISLWFSLRR